ncbi:MAG: DNA repair protein RecN [Fusobacteriaceae bacterium]|jgi:DNA repair protein RecN (Recombination protein N)|nr:DNA repair protein RecN [Fusobacteriaceae bacterium]MBP6467009.1 DNA repair protein RecN [Fusobacteriaceae bacterium]
MLRELTIENLAIIEKLDVEFENSLVTLTGETGAGKSIILNGINLLIGEKAFTEMIRDGEDYLLAQGVFEVNETQTATLIEMGIEVEEGELIVQRRFEKSGKGKAFVNGRRVPLGALKEIMGTLVDLVGQHSHQLLLDSKYHITLIDRFLDNDGQNLKKEIEEIVQNYHKIHKEIINIEEIKKEFSDKKELYEFQLQDIENLKLKDGEDEELEEEYKKLFNAGKITENLGNSLMMLKEGEINTLSILSNAKKNLDYISKYGKEYEELAERIDKIYYDIQDLSDLVDDSLSDVESDDHRLNIIVDRLDKINSLKKKYGISIKDILRYKEEISEKLSKLDSNSFEEEKLKKLLDKVLLDYNNKAEKLTESRKKVSQNIEVMLQAELSDLNMASAKFKVSFLKEEKVSKNGKDSIEFLIATNVGQDYKTLTKIASGGEVSRIMLALKTIFSKVDNIPILIFDEIDIGVGGETVRKIAGKLKEIGKHAQVICITHSPQIAAKATQQFYIEKNVVANTTVTTVRELNQEERVREIGRMLAGENITDTVLSHALELLKED